MEKYLILFPTTFILVPGLLYMILMPLGDAISVFSNGSLQKQVTFLSFEALTLLSAGSLYSIWLATNSYLDNNVIFTFKNNPYIIVFLIIGIVISLLSVVEIIYPAHYIKQVLQIPEKTAFFIMFIFGLPICIPAIHILGISQSKCASNAFKRDAEKAPRPLT